MPEVPLGVHSALSDIPLNQELSATTAFGRTDVPPHVKQTSRTHYSSGSRDKHDPGMCATVQLRVNDYTGGEKNKHQIKLDKRLL